MEKPGKKTAAQPWPEHLYFVLHFTSFPGNMVEVGAALLLRYLNMFTSTDAVLITVCGPFY